MPTDSAPARRQAPADASRRLQALTEISHLVGLGLDPTAIMDHIAQAISRLLDSPYARLWQLDESTGDLVLVAAAGVLSPTSDIGRRRPATLNTINHQILTRGEIFQSTDLDAEPGWHNTQVSSKLGLKTYVGVPLIVGDRKYGLLTLRFTHSRMIPQEDIELVKAIVAHAAIALHNAAAYAESRRHEERLRTLAEITQLINSNLELEAVLQATVETARRLLGARVVMVWIYDEGTQLLNLKAHDPVDSRVPVRTLRMDDSVAGWVLQLGEPYMVQDLANHPLWKGNHPLWKEHQAPKPGHIRGGAFVPFYLQGRPLGVLVVLNERDQRFDVHDMQLLQTLSDQAAVAVQNARLYAAARNQAEQLTAMLRVNRHLTLGRRIEEVLEIIAEDAARFMDVEAAGVRLVDGDQLTHGASYGEASALAVHQHQSIDTGLSGEVVRTKQPVISADLPNDPRTHPDNRKRATGLGFRCWMGVPLKGRERVLGTLFLVTRRHREFQQNEVQLLEAFADQAVVAMENARLFAQEQARQRQLEAIRVLVSDITQELDLENVLNLAITGAAELMNAAYGALYLWDETENLLLRRTAYGVASMFPAVRLALGEGTTGVAAATRESIVENEYRHSTHVLPQVVSSSSIFAALSEPILFQDRLVGVITLGHDDRGRQFTEDDARIMSIFAGQVAIAIENARLFRQAARAEALDELARLKTEFLSTVSHELRTPLSLIHGYSELLVERGDHLASEQVRTMAGEIHTGSKTMARLVDDLLDFSRIEQGRLELKRRNASITDLIRVSANGFADTPAGKRLRVDVQEGIQGEVDPDRLSQIVKALLDNAAQFAPEGPISLRAARDANWLTIEVTDQGPGVPLAEQERVWEKFFRGAAAVNSPVRGSGLGLALARHIAELHGGEVGVRSLPGQGATFWIRIPV